MKSKEVLIQEYIAEITARKEKFGLSDSRPFRKIGNVLNKFSNKKKLDNLLKLKINEKVDTLAIILCGYHNVNNIKNSTWLNIISRLGFDKGDNGIFLEILEYLKGNNKFLVKDPPVLDTNDTKLLHPCHIDDIYLSITPAKTLNKIVFSSSNEFLKIACIGVGDLGLKHHISTMSSSDWNSVLYNMQELLMHEESYNKRWSKCARHAMESSIFDPKKLQKMKFYHFVPLPCITSDSYFHYSFGV